MVKFINPMGVITISQDVISNIVGYAVTSCFGVVGMSSRNPADGFVSVFSNAMLKRENIDHGVKIRVDGDALLVDVHIVVRYGINIGAIVPSIVNKVRYTLERTIGVQIKKITVYVDSIEQEFDSDIK